tara:strand:- start:1818 stop:2321 length:504 start_codon:yes stop_codon:yes gene_type:complete
MQLKKIFTTPQIALGTFTTWVAIFVIILGVMGAFSKKFMHFGPSTDPETSATFLGAPIDTWPKTILLYILGFLSSIISSYYNLVFGAWTINNIHNEKNKDLSPISKKTAKIMLLISPIASNINHLLELFLTLTLQLQFILPQLLGDILASILVSLSFLNKKRKFGKE